MMTKEEFVEKFIHDQYVRKLKARNEYFCNDADIHNINNCNKVKKENRR